MDPISFNLKYLKKSDDFYFAYRENPIPELQALYYLMTVTGINRLFEEDDLYELLRRSQILFPELDMINRFMTEDIFLEFYWKNGKYALDSDFLKNCIGFEAHDAALNQIAPDFWDVGISDLVSGANFFGAITKTVTLGDSIVKNGDTVEIKTRSLNQESLTDEENKRAEILASTVIKEIPKKEFQRLKIFFPNKFLELEMRRKSLNLPEFKFDSLSKKKQEILWKHFYPDMENFEDKETREYYEKFFYLAWLWANDFILDDDINNVQVDPRIEGFDYMDYSIDDMGYNLYESKLREDLGKLFPLLEEPQIKKLAERPWEKLELYGADRKIYL